jgi:hypothetical protein
MKMKSHVSRGRRMVCGLAMLCGARCDCPLLMLCETVTTKTGQGKRSVEKEKEEEVEGKSREGKEKKRRRMKGKGREAERSVVKGGKGREGKGVHNGTHHSLSISPSVCLCLVAMIEGD